MLPAGPASVDMAGATLGLPGLVVLAAAEYGGELELLVETTESVTGCPRCGVVGAGSAGRWSAGGAGVVQPGVALLRARLPAAHLVAADGGDSAARRAHRAGRAECARRVGQDATDVARVAVDLGVGWGTVMRAVREYGQKILDEQWLHTHVSVLGLDETAFLAATATTPTRLITGLVDLSPARGGPARLLDVVEGRSGQVVTDWLDERGPDWCTDVRVAALDPFRGYERALRAGLPAATVVLDAFHAIRLAQDAVDAVRRRVQQDTTGHRGRRGDPLYGIRRLLLRGAENLTPQAYARMLAALDAGDPRGEVAAAYIACQELRHLYAPDLDRARRRLYAFSQACALPGVPELERLGRTIAPWETQLLAHFTTGGRFQRPHRSLNPLVKRTKRVGFGFCNFANDRLRLLLHCGVTWHTHRATRIRARSPRSMS